MKPPTGKLALAYRSLAVAEERAERFMAERDALQALLNERDERLGKATQLLRDVSEYTRHPDYDWFSCDTDEVAEFLSSPSA